MAADRLWRPKFLRCQSGAALLIAMLILVTITMTVLLKGLGHRNMRRQQENATTLALAKAKEALIGYALTHGDYFPAGNGPGHLPCPDTDPPVFDGNGDPLPPYGIANTPCGPNAIGRLPHSIILTGGNRLPLSSHDSGLDQQFWYAVSDRFLATAAGTLNTTVNSATTPTLTLDGQTEIVAVIIAPGPALANQNRPGANAGDYLEEGNITGPHFVTSNSVGPDRFNDQAIAVRRGEVMPMLTARVAAEIKKYLDAFHLANGFYPADQASFVGAFTGAPSWLVGNSWLADTITTYVRVSADRATLTFAGCGITYTLNFGATTIGRSQPHC